MTLFLRAAPWQAPSIDGDLAQALPGRPRATDDLLRAILLLKVEQQPK
jgi:hypothetical protein